MLRLMDESQRSSGDVERRSDPPRSSYLSEIHIEMVTLLVVVFHVLLAVGWSLRPRSSGYPSVPHGFALSVDADGVSLISVTLTRNADNSTVLTVIGNDGYWNLPATLNVSSPGNAQVCQPRHGDIVDPDQPANSQPMIPYPRLVVSHRHDVAAPAMVLQSKLGLLLPIVLVVERARRSRRAVPQRLATPGRSGVARHSPGGHRLGPAHGRHI